MLTKCPECNLNVSDKATSCPHCGYPLVKTVPRKRSAHKHKRLPNGFGQISEIKSGNLRNSYRAMISIGKRPNGKPITKMLKPIAYFKTYNEAYEALIEYHKNPYAFDEDITFEGLYKRWSSQYLSENQSESSKYFLSSVWPYCYELYDVPLKTIKTGHLKECLNNAHRYKNGVRRDASPGTKTRLKTVFNKMFDYALEFDLVDKNYARSFTVSKNITNEMKNNRTKHIPFTEEEISKLWANLGIVSNIDLILIQCYSGLRPKELCLITRIDTNIKDGYMVGGLKTEAGKNRVIPIHSKISNLVLSQYNRSVESNSKRLFSDADTGQYLTYGQYKKIFDSICEKLQFDPNHRPHDGRAHFITEAKKYNVDEYAIKYIVGHSITDVTESVYTTRHIKWLKEEIEKIE